jgi:hypothetical protein
MQTKFDAEELKKASLYRLGGPPTVGVAVRRAFSAGGGIN